ncbi:exo-beta-N-acetylmuramidase NamZ domain-containing protein [Polyangium sp. y55x31]|uniref:exo-beta-N-acetylmuramidase NamZ domain-containing protein n=1 Tax=Polyangium sp. y55x31 TaxID=3042688 RepID=UPI00248325DC|nr:exo-beta-N-acetylmuramidase NamZ domain-containing protein [Polyangium sp. y55x31]MDI1478545.1 DUF1343 domain-containing protein [Polyangium sp. y55x31]
MVVPRPRHALTLALTLCVACAEARRPEANQTATTATASAPAFASASASASAPATASAPASATIPASASASASALPALAPDAETRLDAAIRGAIDRGEVPGAVLLVVQAHHVVLRKAYGLRATEPSPSPMATDAVFDLASLTKPIATASSILLLAERNSLRLDDPAQKWLPDFTGDGRERVTLRHLLLHTSGLPAGDAITSYADGEARALARIQKTKLLHPPGEAHVYSDLGYILLGEIVRRASGEPLDVFAQTNLFGPLGMKDTTFRPGPRLAARVVPTEKVHDKLLVGEVHDPRARALGGVAGHAGLFSTADDLGRFVRMLLGGGEFEGRRILAETTVRAMTTLEPVPLPEGSPDKPSVRSLALGSLFGGAGHTGFTGTAFWLDVRRGDAVVLLASRLHPDGKGDAARMRRDVANAAAAVPRSSPAARVRVGIDVLEARRFDVLAGRKIGLITNHTGKDARGERTIDVLAASKSFELKAVFSPEHGLGADKDALVPGGKDARTGLPIHSLYGADRRPTDAMLAGLDTLVFDVQDAGTRFYTYISTMGYALEEAAKRSLRFVVLDRPNPLGGVDLDGPLVDPGRASFVAYHSIPVRHGMTVGELARLFDAEKKLGADLHVVPLEGWARSTRFEKTGLPWVNPSPNLRSVTEALLYPGVGLLELTNVSVGRGTEKPFERVGAPFLSGARLAAELSRFSLPGVRFSPVRFTPTSSTHAGLPCEGVSLDVTDPAKIQPVRVGLAIAIVLRRLHPEEWKPSGLLTLLGSARVHEALVRGEDLPGLVALYEQDLKAFSERRRPHLLYPVFEKDNR